MTAVTEHDPRETLDRLRYAEARARGLPLHKAAQAAGSEARSVQALCNSARALEAEPEVQAAIEAERAAIKARTDRAWERSLEVLAEDIDHPEPQARRGAIELLGKIRGAFVQKHEHSGPDGGPITLPVHLMFGRPKGQGATLPPDPGRPT